MPIRFRTLSKWRRVWEKNIYSLPELARVLGGANRRYLEFLSAVDDPTNGIKDLDKVSRPVQADCRIYRFLAGSLRSC